MRREEEGGDKRGKGNWRWAAIQNTRYGPLIRSCRGNPCSAKLSVPVPTENHSGERPRPKPRAHPSSTHLSLLSARSLSPKFYTQLLQRNIQTVSTHPNFARQFLGLHLASTAQLLKFTTPSVCLKFLYTRHCHTSLVDDALFFRASQRDLADNLSSLALSSSLLSISRAHSPPITTTINSQAVLTRHLSSSHHHFSQNSCSTQKVCILIPYSFRKLSFALDFTGPASIANATVLSLRDALTALHPTKRGSKPALIEQRRRPYQRCRRKRVTTTGPKPPVHQRRTATAQMSFYLHNTHFVPLPRRINQSIIQSNQSTLHCI